MAAGGNRQNKNSQQFGNYLFMSQAFSIQTLLNTHMSNGKQRTELKRYCDISEPKNAFVFTVFYQALKRYV